MELRVSADPAAAAAAFVASRLRDAVDRRGSASIAVSGGSTAPVLFAALVESDSPAVPWDGVRVWQVDERVAPDGHDDRNAGQLDVLPANVSPMPVTDEDLERAADTYGSELDCPLDVVHLGLGSDGHTASWPPAPHPDATRALESDADAFVIEAFNGRKRMTLGPRVVNSAACRVVLATGSSKAPVVAAWVALAGTGEPCIDVSLPIAAVTPRDTVVFLDEAAARQLDPG